MNNNLDLFICAHKPCVVFVSDKSYKVITNSDGVLCTNSSVEIIKDNSTDEISNMVKCYGELGKIYYAWKYLELKDYVGFCHYSRFFEFYDNVPDMDKLFEKHDCVAIDDSHYIWPYNSTLYDDWCVYKNPDDLVEIGDIIHDNFNEYFPTYVDCIARRKWHQFNMFIMRKDDFYRYCEFMFGVLEIFCNRHDIHSDEDALRYINDIKDKTHYKNIDFLITDDEKLNYLSRLCGFIGEHLTNIFIKKNFVNVKQYLCHEMNKNLNITLNDEAIKGYDHFLYKPWKSVIDDYPKAHNTDNIEIFISTHRDFKWKPINQSYKIICEDNGAEFADTKLQVYRTDTIEEINNIQTAWSEFARMYWVWRRHEIKDYVGFCHYRRFFDFLNGVPDMEKVFKDYDIIVFGTDDHFPNTYLHWQSICDGFMLQEINKILAIAKRDKLIGDIPMEFWATRQYALHGSFVTTKEIFKEYCEFVFPMMFRYIKEYDIITTDDLEKYVKEHNNGHDEFMQWQMRLFGYFMEFSLKLFIYLKKLKPLECGTYHLFNV